MGRRRSVSRDAVVVTLLGSDGKDAEVEGGTGSSGSRSRKRKGRPEKIEVSTVSARCSFSQFYDVIQGFSENKKELVRETGFGGLLSFPALRVLDRKFVVWLMCRVDALEHSLIIDEDRKIQFGKEDVGLVFGIPSGGMTVVGNPRPKKDIVSRVMCDIIGLKDRRNRSIKVLLEVLNRDYGLIMSSRECTAFKVAFVIYAMSTVLTPGSRFDNVCLDYVHVFLDDKEIGSYDWSEFVFRKLIDAVTHMKIGLRSTKKVVNITGCSLFLQVIYLDSIDLGVWTMEHKTLPRVSCFSADRLKYMIRADTLEHTRDCTHRIFGTRPLLPAGKVCYSWAAGVNRSSMHRPSEVKDALWEATVSLARGFDIRDKEAVPLFDIVAGIDMDVGAKILTAVASFVAPYVKLGRVGEADVRCVDNLSGSDGRMDTITCSQHVGESSNGAMTIGCGRGLRSAVLPSAPGLLPRSPVNNLNGYVSGDDSDVSLRSGDSADNIVVGLGGNRDLVGIGSEEVKDPWDLGFHFRYSREAAVLMLSELRSVYAKFKEYGSCPNDVALLISELEGNSFGDDELRGDVVDAVLRSMRCRDALVYGGCGPLRWRHFVESTFVESLLRGNFDSSVPVARHNFDCEYIGYDVSSCKMVFFPARLGDRWVCYAWKVDVDQWVVFDPLRLLGDVDEISKFHDGMVQLIRNAVRQVQSSMCSSWSYSAGKAVVHVMSCHDWFVRSNRSGFACLYFCCMYDGVNVRGDFGLGDVGSEGPVIIAEALDALKAVQKNKFPYFNRTVSTAVRPG